MIRRLLEILACPVDRHHPLHLIEFVSSGEVVSDGVLLCAECGRYFPIIDEVPVMLPDNLRNRREDLAFLDRWKAKLPGAVVTAGKPWNQSSA